MPKFNPEDRSSAPDVDLRDAYQNVDPFDPLSIKRRQDWLDYINTRPAIDEDGNVYDPETGQPVEVNMEDDGNLRHYSDTYDATLNESSRENMGILSLARLANEAYLRGDKTMLSDLEGEIIEKLADIQEKNHLSQEAIDTHMEKLNAIVYAGNPVGEQKPVGSDEVVDETSTDAGHNQSPATPEDNQPPATPEDNPSSLEERVAVLEDELRKALEQLNEKKKPKWSWEKFGKRTVLKWLAGVSLVATGVASVFAAGYGISAAAQEKDGPKAASTYELNSNSNTEDDSTFSTMVDLGRGRQGSETSTNNEADTVRGYNRGEDPFFAEGKTAEYNMSNGFDVNGAPEQARTGWLDDVLRSPEMMSMVMAEAGLNNNPAELDDLLTNSPVYFEQHRELVRQLIENATNVHYETLPAGTVYNTWYTALDENGDPQLVQSEGISHDHGVTLLVMTVQGKDGQEFTIKINSECGQGISAQMYDNVPVFIPDTGTPDQPVTPGDNTPPTPTTPGEGTPPPATPGDNTPPTTPPENPGGETPGDEVKPDDPNDYARPGAGSEADSGEGKKPLSEVTDEAQNPAEVQQQTSEGDSSSNPPASETNIDAAGTNDNTVDASGSVEDAGGDQTNTGTVTGP